MADIVEISKRISELPYYNGGFEQAAKDDAMLPLSVGAATNARLGVGEFSRYINQSIDGKLKDALSGLAELEDLEDLERRLQDQIDHIELIPGPPGEPGQPGEPGSPGIPGAAATVSVGTTTTGSAGTNASVSNSGTPSEAVFNFTIPRGATGATGTAATVSVGTTTTGLAGTNASVTNSGTSSAAVFNFTIPRGATGATGAPGSPGTTLTAGVVEQVRMGDHSLSDGRIQILSSLSIGYYANLPKLEGKGSYIVSLSTDKLNGYIFSAACELMFMIISRSSSSSYFTGTWRTLKEWIDTRDDLQKTQSIIHTDLSIPSKFPVGLTFWNVTYLNQDYATVMVKKTNTFICQHLFAFAAQGNLGLATIMRAWKLSTAAPAWDVGWVSL